MFFLIWIICIAVATAIGSSKGKTMLGFFMGFLLGIIGVIIMLCVSPAVPVLQVQLVACPHCRTGIHPEATVCPQCRLSVR
jgi:hypothetical protein